LDFRFTIVDCRFLINIELYVFEPET